MVDESKVPKKASRQLKAIENGEEKLLVTIRFDTGTITFDGDEGMIEDLRAGIQDTLSGETITPEDGYVYLVALEEVYNGTYLFVTPIVEE